MAKAKPLAGATKPIKPVKETVSLAKAFKVFKRQPLRKGESRIPKPTTKKLSLRGEKPVIEQKHKSAPQHPLAALFNERLDKSESTINEVYTYDIKSTTKGLLQRLHTSNEEYATSLEVESKIDETFNLPLAEEGIDYALCDGSQVRHTTLGAQVKLFQKKIAAEEKELESLCRQWNQVQEELLTVAEDILGADRATVLAVLGGGHLEESLVVADAETAEAIEKDQKHFEELIDTSSQQAMEKMIASEKDFQMKQTERQKNFLKLFKDEDEAAEE